jgi:hypothetical protein
VRRDHEEQRQQRCGKEEDTPHGAQNLTFGASCAASGIVKVSLTLASG